MAAEKERRLFLGVCDYDQRTLMKCKCPGRRCLKARMVEQQWHAGMDAIQASHAFNKCDGADPFTAVRD